MKDFITVITRGNVKSAANIFLCKAQENNDTVQMVLLPKNSTEKLLPAENTEQLYTEKN